jgi:cobalt/nickel transport system permease protein
VLGEYAMNLLSALKLRSVGKNKAKQRSLSGIAGTLFLRSGHMARTLHQAMECRGFTGSYIFHRRLRFGIETPILLGMDGLLIAAFLLWGHP